MPINVSYVYQIVNEVISEYAEKMKSATGDYCTSITNVGPATFYVSNNQNIIQYIFLKITIYKVHLRT